MQKLFYSSPFVLLSWYAIKLNSAEYLKWVGVIAALLFVLWLLGTFAQAASVRKAKRTELAQGWGNKPVRTKIAQPVQPTPIIVQMPMYTPQAQPQPQITWLDLPDDRYEL